MATQGIIMDLVSTGLPPSVAGIVGLNVLSQFDVEFDFVKEHITLFEVGAVERGHCSKEGLQKLAVAPISFSLPGLQVRLTSMQYSVHRCFCLFGSAHCFILVGTRRKLQFNCDLRKECIGL